MHTPRVPDFVVVSDGSGYHKDAYGGWACAVIYERYGACQAVLRMGAIIGATVDRMEMTAILEGLHEVDTLVESHPGLLPVRKLGENRPYVQIYSDRENLVKSIQRVYDRSNSPDLWARYSYFETRMDINATHVKIEEFPPIREIDLHASTARLIAKTYGDTITFDATAFAHLIQHARRPA